MDNSINKLLKEYISKNHDIKYKIHISPDLDIDSNLVKNFINFSLDFLGISSDTKNLTIVLSSSRDNFTTYAFYAPNEVQVYSKGRAIIDIFRSLAHELVHYKQDLRNELKQEYITPDNDGTPIENEANSIAGVIMRKFGRENKNLY